METSLQQGNTRPRIITALCAISLLGGVFCLIEPLLAESYLFSPYYFIASIGALAKMFGAYKLLQMKKVGLHIFIPGDVLWMSMIPFQYAFNDLYAPVDSLDPMNSMSTAVLIVSVILSIVWISVFASKYDSMD